MAELSDLFEDASTKWLERERDRLYALQREASASLSEVKAELMRRALIESKEGQGDVD